MEVILIRHGQTKNNQEKRYMGTIDQPITPEGRKIAQQTALILPSVEKVFVSPMIRCQQTSALLFPGKEPVTVEELREMNFGAFEGKTYEELKGDVRYRQWLDSDGSMACPHGESRNDFAKRCGSAFWQLLEKEQNQQERIAIVAHGGTLMTLLTSYGEENRAYFDWLRPNCCGYLLQADRTSRSLKILEEIGLKINLAFQAK